MPENKELNCITLETCEMRNEICDMRFDHIEQRLDRHEVNNEQRREEVQAIKEAMVAIQGAYEHTTADIKDIKALITGGSNDKLWKLFEKIIIVLITLAGVAAGINIPK